MSCLLYRTFPLSPDFDDDLKSVEIAEGLLEAEGDERRYQVAGFHADYRFADAPEDDPANDTNRSRYPMLHLLREESMENVLDRYPDPHAIPERNIADLTTVGVGAIEILEKNFKPRPPLRAVDALSVAITRKLASRSGRGFARSRYDPTGDPNAKYRARQPSPSGARSLRRDGTSGDGGRGGGGCAPSSSGGCRGPVPIPSTLLAYSAAETTAVPDGADLGLGCGNPQAIAALKPGGRLAISDILATAELPDDLRSDLSLHTGCMAGAARIDVLEQMLRGAGFEQVSVSPNDESRNFIRDWAPGTPVTDYLVSASIEANEPG